MSKIPAIEGNELVKILSEIGFQVKRQRGSHVFLGHPDGRATVVPIHSGETLGPGLLAKILRDIELTKAQFLKLLRH